MAATKFLDDLLDSFVCVADVITSVAYSDERKILPLNDSARVVLGCLRSAKKAVKGMQLDKAGLPVLDAENAAIAILSEVAGDANYSDLKISSVVFDEVLKAESKKLLEFGFSQDIWSALHEGDIQTSWRPDHRTGLRKYSFLSSVWKATPREIAVLLEEQGYKRPIVISLIRKGYAMPAISLVGVLERTANLGIDQEVDLGDVRQWFSKNGIDWPIPLMAENRPGERSNDLPKSSSDDVRGPVALRLKELERQNSELLKQNADLRAQLLSLECRSVEGRENRQSLTFPYTTKELEVMREVALKYWAQYTPEMRQPKQDTIQREFCSLLGLNTPAEKTPPHKAIYLATAIKPDHLLKP